MERKVLAFSIVLFLIIGVLAGFSYYDITPNNSSRSGNIPLKSVSPVERNLPVQNPTDGNPIQNAGINYMDNFDGANDTTALKARGYKVFYRSGGAQVGATWFQGNPAVFPAFNGPLDGYVAANFQVVSGTNNIDNWLILPRVNTGANDSLFFYSRAPGGSTFPDSIRVMYSTVGDSVPEAASWVELGRFKVNTADVWELRGFKPTAAGANARFAIRYKVVNGGPTGANSDFIGIDALTIGAQPPPPLVDIVEVSNVYALGKKPIICYDTNYIRVRLSHKRAQTDTINVNTRIKNVGGFVKFNINDVIIMTGVRDSIITRFYTKPDSIKVDSIIATATANGEQVTTNNRATYLSQNTPNGWNYAIESDPVDGGVGFNGGTGDFVAKFYANCSLPIYAVDLTFDAIVGGGNQPYNVVIFADAGGIPGAVLYTSAPLVSPPGAATPQLVTHNLPIPVNISGNFYVGISQTGTVNIAFGFQDETPIRNNSFFFRAPVGTGVWTDFSSAGANFRLDICPRTSLNLNLTLLIEGFWNGTTNISDTVTVELHSTTTPFALIDDAKSVKSASGTLSLSFNAPGDEAYYIVIRHRNALETWSKAGGVVFAPNPKSYDFTTAASQAFGNNLTFKAGKFTLYSGDVNQDGVIDLTDLSMVDNDAFNFIGGYVPTDVNGDGLVDVADAAIVDNNAFNFIGVIRP
ncbi:MAG: choice-of-anchor J domain-containing protein [Bacteroidota bacterium]|nr:choice-of-anchor J domain-containing protein [Bacteroidota bacterium]